MWFRISHLLQPPTALTPEKVTSTWKNKEQKEFDDIKRIVAHNTLLKYLAFNNWFDIHMDARDYQLGA